MHPGDLLFSRLLMAFVDRRQLQGSLEAPDERAHAAVEVEPRFLTDKHSLTYENRNQLMYQSVHIRKSVLLELINARWDTLSSFLPCLIDEYIAPLWRGVRMNSKSPIAVLPEVCSFPVIPVPPHWFDKDSPGAGFILGKTYSGSWTIIDSSLVRNPSARSRPTPKILIELVVSLNEKSGTSSSATVVFDEGTNRVLLLDMDWASEKVMLTDILHNERREVRTMSPGAINFAGVYNGSFILSSGADIHVLSLDDAAWSIPSALSTRVCERKLPISIQTVASFVDSSSRVYFISEGALWCGSRDGKKQCLHSDAHAAFVSLVYDRSSEVLVLTGFDTRVSMNTKYVTLYDLPGRFVISTTSFENPFPTSIISTAVDIETSELLFVGKSDRFSRYGSLCYSVPALYN